MSNISLEGKAAIVTGGGGGMGKAMALGLVAAGARVAFVDINQHLLDGAIAEARALGGPGDATSLAADLTDADACAQVAEMATEAFGPIGILINNAGLGMRSLREDYMNQPLSFWEAEIEPFDRLMAINYRAPFLMARALVPDMLAGGWGRVVNVTTSLDTMIRPNYTPYGQSKAALEAATATWAKDLDGTGVTANVLVPGGPTNTDFISPDAPFDRTKLIQPEVMVAPACWLVSDASNWINGMRFIGNSWDPARPDSENIELAGAPAAWPDAATEAFWPDKD